MGPSKPRVLAASLALVLGACEPGVLNPNLTMGCAADGTCPNDLSCDAAWRCVEPTLGAPCGGSSCAAAAAGATCGYGLCVAPCVAGCAQGERCTPFGYCLRDCTDFEPCPEGLACQPLYDGDGSGCMAPGVEANACASVSGSPCQYFTCPDWVVPCGTGYCPRNSGCDDGGETCTCYGGYTATDCGLGNDEWGCAPPGAVAGSPDCFRDLVYFSGGCQCVDGRYLSFSCSTSGSCHELCAAPYETP